MLFQHFFLPAGDKDEFLNPGFARFGEFMEFYGEFMGDRATYPYLEDFYPQIVSWVAGLK